MENPDRATYERLTALLRRYREVAGMRQTEVAKHLGRPQSFVSKFESNERKLDVIELFSLLKLYGRSLIEFQKDLGLEDGQRVRRPSKGRNRR